MLISEGITYLCMADETFGRRVPFTFLEEVRRRFTSTYGAAANHVRCPSPSPWPLRNPDSSPRRQPGCCCSTSGRGCSGRSLWVGEHNPLPRVCCAPRSLNWWTGGFACAQALAYAYNVEFSRVLNQQMDYFSSNPSADSIERVKGEIAQVKSGLVDNIDKVRSSTPPGACVGVCTLSPAALARLLRVAQHASFATIAQLRLLLLSCGG